MTVRLCLIGNSHLAALALGWRQIAPRYPDIAITFFGAKASFLDGLRVFDRGLRAEDDDLRKKIEWLSGGISEIVVDDYDAFWFVGNEFGVHTVLAPYLAYWAEAHTPDPKRTPVSDALFLELGEAALRGTLAMDLFRRLRQTTDAPVSFVCQPEPSAAALESREGRTQAFRLAERQGDRVALAEQAARVFASIEARERVTVLRQPDETRAGPLLTQAHWGRGSVRLQRGLSTEHGDHDLMHMNGDYGAIMLAACLDTLTAHPSVPVSLSA